MIAADKIIERRSFGAQSFFDRYRVIVDKTMLRQAQLHLGDDVRGRQELAAHIGGGEAEIEPFPRGGQRRIRIVALGRDQLFDRVGQRQMQGLLQQNTFVVGEHTRLHGGMRELSVQRADQEYDPLVRDQGAVGGGHIHLIHAARNGADL